MAITLPVQAELTIATGAITVSVSGTYPVDTEADALDDDLDTISGGTEGDVILLYPASAARTVRLRHNIDNIRLPGGLHFSLNDQYDHIYLVLRSATWIGLMNVNIP